MIHVIWYDRLDAKDHEGDFDTAESAFDALRRGISNALAYPIGTDHGGWNWQWRDSHQYKLEDFKACMEGCK